MKIIILSGKSNCGKTTTINLAYKQLTGSFFAENERKDFETTIKYKNKLIAFYSMGDESNPLIKAINNYENLNCDILICACNVRFKKPYKIIERNSENIKIDKTMPLSDNANTIDANLIISNI